MNLSVIARLQLENGKLVTQSRLVSEYPTTKICGHGLLELCP